MNELKNILEFQKILKDYSVSSRATRLLAETDVLLLAGVTSSGRNTVVRELLKTGDYHYIVSDTTRKPRLNHGIIEQNGVEYWFKTEDEFLEGLNKGLYLEAAVIHEQQVSGISISEVEAAHQEGKIATTDIEIAGVASIVAAKPDTVCVFMIPPNFDEWIHRIQGRGHMSDKELSRRLRSAVTEIRESLNKDYFTIVINNNFVETASYIHNIFCSLPDQEIAKEVAKRLLEDTIKYLQTKC